MTGDRTLQKLVGALQMEIRRQTDGLCDFPKSDPFEHGVQVGTCLGLKQALALLEAVVEDTAKEDSRR